MRISVQIEFDKTMDIETRKTSVTVGRSPNSDVMIPHESISRTHCRVEIENGVFHITDLGSSNGTFIDGQRIRPEKRTTFFPTSQITLGKLECEFSDGGLTEEHVTKAHKIEALNSDSTMTIRLARLDLNTPSKSIEMEKKNSVKGPKNPITHGIKDPKYKEQGDGKKLYIVLFIVISFIAYYLYQLARS